MNIVVTSMANSIAQIKSKYGNSKRHTHPNEIHATLTSKVTPRTKIKFLQQFTASRTIAPEEHCPPTLNLTLIQTLTLTGGQLPSWTIVRILVCHMLLCCIVFCWNSFCYFDGNSPVIICS